MPLPPLPVSQALLTVPVPPWVAIISAFFVGSLVVVQVLMKTLQYAVACL